VAVARKVWCQRRKEMHIHPGKSLKLNKNLEKTMKYLAPGIPEM